MVLGIGPAPVDAAAGRQAVLGPHHDGEEEQEAVSDAAEGVVHFTLRAGSTADYDLLP